DESPKPTREVSEIGPATERCGGAAGQRQLNETAGLRPDPSMSARIHHPPVFSGDFMTITSTVTSQSRSSDLTSTRPLSPDMVLTEGPRGATKRQGRESLPRNASDDEILGIMSSSAAGTPESPQLALDFDKANGDDGRDADSEADGSPWREGRGEGDSERLQSVLEENPELRRAWDDASAYREMFATPEDAKAATGLLTELNQIDALFFSKRTEDHATLARHIAQMDPAAFALLAREIQRVAGTGGTASWGASQIESRGALQNGENRQQSPQMDAAAAQENHGEERANQLASQSAQVTPEQADFLRATNAAAVQGVIDAVENQVEKLLPESTPKGARNRIVGEIYREL